MPVIKLVNITKVYQMGAEEVHALRGVSLEIARNEYVAIMGPSGSGKSTLMNIIGCLDTPTAGLYELNNTNVSDMNDNELAKIRNKEIGFVFQTFNRLARSDVLHNVELPLIYGGVSSSERKRMAKEALLRVGLGDRMAHKPNELSGGQRQRVAVARALAVEPAVLLMDEPLSNLDALLRLEMRTELKAVLAEARTTTLYVTHDQTEAMGLADRIAIMHEGCIEQIGSPLEIYRQPKSIFVGGFIGNPPMNFLRLPVSDSVVRLGTLTLNPPAGVNGPVMLGIRPEDLEVVETGAGFAFRVHVPEPLGPHILLTGDVEGQSVRVAVAPDRVVRPGDVVMLRPNTTRVSWMNPDTGLALESA